MSPVHNRDGADEPAVMPPHTKRVGRELAMLYLFGVELNREAAARDRGEFFADVAGIMQWRAGDRVFRKGREFAEYLLDLFVNDQEKIDETIKGYASNWEWSRISLVDRNIMRVAVCEMLHVPDVPPVVSINEAVEIALDYSDANSANFINGVLNAVKNHLSRPAREAVDHL